MKFFFIFLALSFAGPANAAERIDLEAKLPTPATVISVTDAEWKADPYSAGASGYSYLELKEIHLSPSVVRTLDAGPAYPAFGDAAATLYHEWAHVAFQSRNEGFVECIAQIELRYLLRHYWHASSIMAQADYVYAWNMHLGLPPNYLGDCHFQQFDPLGSFA